MDYKELKNIYEKILEFNSDIFLCISEDKIDEIQSLLDEKNILSKKIKKLGKKISLTEEQQFSLDCIISEIKKKEETIILTFESKKDQIKEELVKTAKDFKLLSAYIIKSEENQPEMFDTRE